MNFDACLAETLKWEGGWSNHPKDPGGPTMKGVIQRVYDAYRARKGLPKQSVRLISDDELKAIYREEYWNLVKGDELPAGVDLAVFDFGVNSGPARSVQKLQACLGVNVDGRMGPVTLQAACNCDPLELINKMMDSRRKFIRQIKTYPTFGKGWERRCNGVEAAAVKMVGVAPLKPAPAPLENPEAQSLEQGRATGEEKKPIPVTPLAVGAGGATAVSQLPPPPPEVTNSVTNLGIWQTLGTAFKSFIDLAVAQPFLVGGIVLGIVVVTLGPWAARKVVG